MRDSPLRDQGDVMSRDRQIAVLASILGLAGLVIGIVALSQNSGADDEWVRNRALPGDSKATSAAVASESESDRDEKEDEASDTDERYLLVDCDGDGVYSWEYVEEEDDCEPYVPSTEKEDEASDTDEMYLPVDCDGDGVYSWEYVEEEHDCELYVPQNYVDCDGDGVYSWEYVEEEDDCEPYVPPTTTPPATTTAPPTDGAANSSGEKKWKVFQDCNDDGIYSWSDVEDIEIDDCEDFNSVNLWDGSYDSSCSSFWGSHQYGCVTTPYSDNGGADYPGVPGSDVMPAYIDTATWMLKPKLHLPNGKPTGHFAVAYAHSYFELQVWCNPNEPIIPKITVVATSKFPNSQAYEGIPFKIKAGDNNNNEWTTVWSPVGLDLPIQSNNTFWITGSNNQFTYQVNVTARQKSQKGAFGTRYGCFVDTIVIGSDQLKTFTSMPGENQHP
jgi:uncharacterized protein YxeA